MTPQAHYQLLKQAMYTPTPPPTMADVDKKTSWWGRNGGATTGLVGGMAAGAAAGSALAPFTAGASIPIGAIAGLGVNIASGIGGDLYDKWNANKRLNQATQQWRQDSQANENAAVHDGSLYGGGLGGFMSGAKDMLNAIPTPAK